MNRACAVAVLASSAARSRSAAPTGETAEQAGEIATRQPLAENRRGEGVDPRRAHPAAPGPDRPGCRRAEFELGPQPRQLDRRRTVERGFRRAERGPQRAPRRQRVGDRDADVRQRPLDRGAVTGPPPGDGRRDQRRAGDRERQRHRRAGDEPAAEQSGEGSQQRQPTALERVRRIPLPTGQPKRLERRPRPSSAPPGWRGGLPARQGRRGRRPPRRR